MSGQQPKTDVRHLDTDVTLHPWNKSPVASETPSGQHPNWEIPQSLEGCISLSSKVSTFAVIAASVESCSIVVACTVVIGCVVVTNTNGQPSFSTFVASVIPSEQQPNNELSHKAGGQSFIFLLAAGDILSGQQPNIVSLHVFGVGHPSSNGPDAAVLLSTAQHPNSVNMQGIVFGFTRHFRGFCSSFKIVDNLFGVVLSARVVD